MKLDALIIAAHPDDAEISLGGTILRISGSGRAVGVVDLTRGEMGSRGDSGTREQEAIRAGELLGLSVRLNMKLPDGRLTSGIEQREALASVIRRHRPDVLFAHHAEDLHPDHAAAGTLTREAWYLSGLRRLAEEAADGEAHRPAHLLHFMGHVPFEPTFVVDVSEVWERKIEAVRAYASQLRPEGPADDGGHFLFGADILARMESKARYWGEKIGVPFGEPLRHEGPLPLGDPILSRLLQA